MGGGPAARTQAAVRALRGRRRWPGDGLHLVGPADGNPESDEGEVYALNVDPERWGRGIGRMLLGTGTSALRDLGFGQVVLWVHPSNERARRFYELAGWRADGGQRQQDVLRVQVPEVRYRLLLQE